MAVADIYLILLVECICVLKCSTSEFGHLFARLELEYIAVDYNAVEKEIWLVICIVLDLPIGLYYCVQFCTVGKSIH